jgi:hypothetical protein
MRHGRTDEQRYAIISPYFDGHIEMNDPYPEITNKKGEQVRGVILDSLENASFHMVYTINWFKKYSIIITVLTLSNRPSIVIKEGGPIMAQLFILSYSDAVSFRDIKGHLGTIPSIWIQ